ncbi:MAG: T9SS type A sorting domain-containing protein [Chitinophagales bacterium]|nr:T9SS type A sorting domain-containing protein [Chitinophagales bacterium]
MKRFLSVLTLMAVISVAQAQLGTAHDFTVTDIDGNEIHLYSILDEGKVVILDVSATWCPPCWTLHQNHYLQDLHEMYGPDGTDQIRVIFYEGDANTNMNDLNGTGSNTLGNWLEGVTYPIVNESPIQLDLSVYAPFGFPTVSVIRPSDREITADIYNYNLQQMIDAINEIVTLGSTSNVSEAAVAANLVDIAPNPATSSLNVDLSKLDQNIEQLIVTNALGQQLMRQPVQMNGNVQVNVSNLDNGFYFLHLMADGETVASKKFIKE